MSKRTLNIGCGDRTYTEYPSGHRCINVDERNLSGVDEIMDVRKLNFPDEYFFYILASDIIEHFKISETKTILTEWKRVLKIGGVIEFRMPNLEAICKKYTNGTYNAKLISWLIFGAGDYPGNHHFVIFDRYWFKEIAESVGLKEIEYKNEDNNFVMKVKKI